VQARMLRLIGDPEQRYRETPYACCEQRASRPSLDSASTRTP
jgi:hypothetical protein